MLKISYILGQQVVAKEPTAATGQPLSLSLSLSYPFYSFGRHRWIRER
jgi:hypothetical protein